MKLDICRQFRTEFFSVSVCYDVLPRLVDFKKYIGTASVLLWLLYAVFDTEMMFVKGCISLCEVRGFVTIDRKKCIVADIGLLMGDFMMLPYSFLYASFLPVPSFVNSSIFFCYVSALFYFCVYTSLRIPSLVFISYCRPLFVSLYIPSSCVHFLLTLHVFLVSASSFSIHSLVLSSCISLFP